MDRVLFKSNKIGIKKSPVHGWGVFALEDIEIGDTIEECLYVPIETYNEGDTIIHYSFPYPRVFGQIKDSNKKIDKLIQVVVLGYGSLYNHSLNLLGIIFPIPSSGLWISIFLIFPNSLAT